MTYTEVLLQRYEALMLRNEIQFWALVIIACIARGNWVTWTSLALAALTWFLGRRLDRALNDLRRSMRP